MLNQRTAARWMMFLALATLKAQETGKPSPPCIAVKSVGSHGLRNVLLGGVAGALISKEQYQVVKVAGYPAQIGQKLHGTDLETIQKSGTKIVILNKKFTAEDAAKACPA